MSQDWHIIKVESSDLSSPAGISDLIPFVQHVSARPVILITHDETPLQNPTSVEALINTLNFSLNRNTSNYSFHVQHIIQYEKTGKIDWEKSQRCVTELVASIPKETAVIIQASRLHTSHQHNPTTDVSGEFEAAVLSRLFEAKNLTLLGEAPGIWSANPDLVKEAFTLDKLSMQEAGELAYLNNGILHPSSLIPLMDQDITIDIRPLGQHSTPGTVITHPSPESDKLAKGITAQTDLALLVIEGLGMMGIPGITAHAFQALASASINVVLLSQASTEQSIGIVIGKEDKDSALPLLESAFEDRLQKKEITRIYALDSVGLVTLVDDRMRYLPGLTGKMFSTLGRSGINVLTIADGASESNISAVVAGEDVRAAVHALHEAFCYGRRVAHVFMFGAGTIGGKLLKLMQQQSAYWRDELNLKISLVGLSNSRHMIWDKSGIAFEDALVELQKAEQPLDVVTILNHLVHSRLDRLIVIDATASDAVAVLYPELLENNIAVITPNKRANTQSVANYDRLHAAARDHQVPYFYETTVGAGLPVISTLRDLVRSGDEILKIEGVVSGTLSYLFNSVSNGSSFADALQTAYDLGYTEPDPRDDLSGEDVARKMLILAREAGLMIERSDVNLSALLPEELMQMPRDQFMQTFKETLADWSPPISLAPGQGVHYVGSIENGQINIGLQAVAPSSALASLQGTENMIIFTTRRYFDTPLIIRGPGAGPAVTAGGVLADLIRAAELVT